MTFQRTLVANVIFASALCAAMAAQAASDASVAAAASQPVANADRIVCHFEQDTGSKIPKRICKTAEAWELERERSLKLIQDAQQRTGSTRGR
jgi:hypothetical protein